MLRLILSPHAVDRQKQDIDTVHPSPSNHNIRLIDICHTNIGAERNFPPPHWINHSAIVNHTIATLQVMVGAKQTGPIDKIHKHPTFSTLWNIQHKIVNDIFKVGNIKFPLEGHVRYILSKEAFTLFFGK